MNRGWVLLGVLALYACGGNTATNDDIVVDDTAGGEATCNLAEVPISTFRLPELPAAFDLLEPAHRAPWDEATAVLEARAPDAPEDHGADAIEAWAQGPLSEYLSAERQALEAAETSLNGLADGPEGVRAVSSTLVGLMYYHLATQIMRTPIPTEIAEDAALTAAYLSAIREGVQPLLDTAADRAEYCVYVSSTQPDVLDRWRLYCFAMIGHTVVAEHRVASLIQEAQHLSHSPEYLERRWGTPAAGARVTPGQAQVEGALEADAVTAFINAHQRPLVACYQRGLAEDENLAGQVVLTFEVRANGRTRNVASTVSTLGREDVPTCLAGAIGDLTFPAPTEGGARVFVALDLRVIPVAEGAPAEGAPAEGAPAEGAPAEGAAEGE